MTAILSAGSYFGSVEGRFVSGPLQLVETRYDRVQRIPRHGHDRAYFCFVLRGGYRERSADREVACRPAMVVFHPRGAVHDDLFGQTGGRCFNLECETSWLADCGAGLEGLAESLYLTDGHVGWLSGQLRREARSNERHADLAIDGLARALVAAVGRRAARSSAATAEPNGPAWLCEAVGLARREYVAGPGLSEIARHVGVHPRHLARVFRDRMGCTLGEFVRRRRIESACRLLLESDDSLSRIAFRTGFADQSHLGRTFKRYVGLTPSEYRRDARPSPPRSRTSL